MRFLISLLLITSSAIAQNTGQNAIYVPVVQNQVITMGTTFTSGPLQNIGQTSHQLLVVVTGQTATYTIQGAIQGASDGANCVGAHWSNIGIEINENPTPVAQIVSILSGFQYYPCIRSTIAIGMGMNTSLTVSIYYTGTSSPSQNLVEMLFSRAPLLLASGTLTAGSTLQIVTSAGGTTPPFPTLYGVTLNLPTTVTATIVGCSVSGSSFDSGAIFIDIPNAVAATSNLIWPVGIRAQGQCNPSEAIYIQVTGTGTVGYSLNYRFE